MLGKMSALHDLVGAGICTVTYGCHLPVRLTYTLVLRTANGSPVDGPGIVELAVLKPLADFCLPVLGATVARIKLDGIVPEQFALCRFR